MPHTTTSRVLLLAALGLLTARCAPVGAPLPTLPATVAWQTPTALPKQRRTPGVIMLSLPSARADLARQFVASGAMPALSRLIAGGAMVDSLQPVDPPLGAPSGASLFSGAAPRRTGIFADAFHPAAQALGARASGYDVPPGAEPIWRSAMRTGAQAAVIGMPAAALESVAYRADWVVSAGAALAPSAQHQLKFSEAKDWKITAPSFSPPREARTTLAQPGGSAPLELFVLALDTTDDRQENYDAWLLSRSKTTDAGAVRLRVGEWATLVVDSMLQASAAFKITDANPANFILYQSALMVNHAAPLVLARDLAAQLGAPPAPADRAALARNWIDEGTFLQMSERQTAWLASAAIYVYRAYQPELLVLQLSVTDDAGRAFLLSLPRQPRYASQSAYFGSGLRRGYEIADEALARLSAVANPASNTLIVGSANGLAPAHTVVNLNRLLFERGWLSIQNGVLDTAKSKAYAEAGDAIAHIYLNLKGREPAGSVEAGDADKLQNDLVASLRDVRDPVDNTPIFARVLRKSELGALGWQHEQAGDIVVQARAGFVVAGGRDRPAVLEPVPPGLLGAGGYAADMPEMRGFLAMGGVGVRRGALEPTARVLDVAPTIGALLRFSLPLTEGKALERLLSVP